MKFVLGNQNIGIGMKPMLQRFVETEDAAWALISKYWDSAPLFASLPFRYNNEKKKTEYLANTIWMELDNEKFENCFMEHQKLEKYAYSIGTDCYGVPTDHGLHSHIMIEPVWISNGAVLADIKRRLVTKLGLRTVDWNVFGDLTKLPRIPNSSLKSGYAIQIYPGETWHQVLEAKLKRRPVYLRRRQVPIHKVIESLSNIEPARFPLTAHEVAHLDLTYVRVKVACEIFQKWCMQRYMSLDNPPSYIRHVAAIYLKKRHNWDIMATADFFQSLGWTDFNRKITEDKIRYAHENYDWSPSCFKIEMKGFCIGSACPFYEYRTGPYDEYEKVMKK